jgi:hypothetical protein
MNVWSSVKLRRESLQAADLSQDGGMFLKISYIMSPARRNAARARYLLGQSESKTSKGKIHVMRRGTKVWCLVSASTVDLETLRST